MFGLIFFLNNINNMLNFCVTHAHNNETMMVFLNGSIIIKVITKNVKIVMKKYECSL